MKIKITWPDGQEDTCCDYDSTEALVAGMWGSKEVPDGVKIEAEGETPKAAPVAAPVKPAAAPAPSGLKPKAGKK